MQYQVTYSLNNNYSVLEDGCESIEYFFDEGDEQTMTFTVNTWQEALHAALARGVEPLFFTKTGE